MTRRSSCRIVVLLLGSALSLQGETLVLSSRFVCQVKNRATIAVNLEVDAHPKSPHPISKGGNDGDIHLAGRADEVRLPLVAEIVNARKEEASVTELKTMHAKTKIPVTGAWRIWFEHLGTAPQIQGDAVPVPSTSNPQHLFEIHPITNFDGKDLLDSFQAIPGYSAYPAATAFPSYEKMRATIKSAATSLSITAGAGKYNYAEFVMEIAGPVRSNKQSDAGDTGCSGEGSSEGDGFLVLANVFDTEDEEEPVTKSPRRMVFVKGTEPARQVKDLSEGDRLHVLGIPRVNLAEAVAIPKNAAMPTRLPYEMIIVAVLP